VSGDGGSGYIARVTALASLLALLLQLQIPAPTGYVNDFAGIIDPASRAAMEAVIDQVRAASKGEIVVVTMRDLKGRAPIEVARDIGRAWKVGAQGAAGDERRNTGVVVLLVPGAHPGDGKAQLAIGTGSGAEGFVTDALAGQIRDAIAQRSVAAGSYAAGLVTGVQLLGAAYARQFGFQLTGAATPPPPAPRPAARNGGWINILVLLVLFSLLGVLGRRRGGAGLVEGMIIGSLLGGGPRGGWGGGGFGGGGFGGFGGGGGFSGGGASGGF
jgi:uncharacterized protein